MDGSCMKSFSPNITQQHNDLIMQITSRTIKSLGNKIVWSWIVDAQRWRIVLMEEAGMKLTMTRRNLMNLVSIDLLIKIFEENDGQFQEKVQHRLNKRDISENEAS